MKTLKFETKEGWLNARLGKSTGSRAKDMLPGRDGGVKKGWYELVAESLVGAAALVDEENAMDRGNRLEPEAIARFVEETGKKVDTSLLMWVREDDERIAISPDGVIGKTAAVEAKCLNAASHIEARITGKIPKNTAGYDEQATQYFVVNDKLKVLYFIFYDPRFPKGLDFFHIEIKRKDGKEQIEAQLEAQRNALKWVRDTVNKLTMYSPEEIKQAEAVQKELVKAYDDAHKEVVSEHKKGLAKVYEGMKARSV